MKWTIYRYELLLFNPVRELYRYVPFHESSSEVAPQSEFAAYRKHVQQLLASLEKWLHFPTGAEINCEIIASSSTDSVDWKMKLSELNAKLHNQGLLERWDEYLNACESEMRDAGLDQYLEDLARLRAFDGAKPFPRDFLYHLMSIMPVHPDWDLPGIFSPARDHEEKKDEQGLFDRIRKLRHAMYAAHLSYGRGQDDKGSRSNELLGYQVNVRCAYADVEDRIGMPIYVAKDDYYSYCYDPQGKSDFAAYRVYGQLVDNILSSLVPNGDDENQDSDLYYLGYPISTVLGRQHFLHIWLKPDHSPGTQPELEDLWTAWAPLHDLLEWPDMRTLIGAELEQLDIAFARARMAADIREALDRPGATLDLSAIVCQHGQILFPVDEFSCTQGRWEYEEEQGKFGRSWKRIPESAPHPVAPIDFKHRPFGSMVKAKTSQFLLGRYHRIVRQQMAFCESIQAELQRQILSKRAWQNKLKADFRVYLQGLSHEERERLWAINKETDGISPYAHPIQNFEGYAAMTLGAILDFFVDEFPLGSSRVDRLHGLLVQDRHFMFAYFLDTDPIKSLTHPGINGNLPKRPEGEAFNRRLEILDHWLDGLDGWITKTFQSQFREILKICREKDGWNTVHQEAATILRDQLRNKCLGEVLKGYKIPKGSRDSETSASNVHFIVDSKQMGRAIRAILNVVKPAIYRAFALPFPEENKLYSNYILLAWEFADEPFGNQTVPIKLDLRLKEIAEVTKNYGQLYLGKVIDDHTLTYWPYQPFNNGKYELVGDHAIAVQACVQKNNKNCFVLFRADGYYDESNNQGEDSDANTSHRLSRRTV